MLISVKLVRTAVNEPKFDVKYGIDVKNPKMFPFSVEATNS